MVVSYPPSSATSRLQICSPYSIGFWELLKKEIVVLERREKRELRGIKELSETLRSSLPDLVNLDSNSFVNIIQVIISFWVCKEATGGRNYFLTNPTTFAIIRLVKSFDRTKLMTPTEEGGVVFGFI